MKYPNLFSKAKLGKLEIANRYVQTPIQTRGADHEGYVTQELLDFHLARAGAGIVMAQQSFAWESVKLDRGLALWDDKYIEKLALLAKTIQSTEAKAFLQLGGSGSRKSPGLKVGDGLAPSPVKGSWDMKVPKELTSEEIDYYINQYAQAGRRLYQAGFDGFSLHGAAGKFIAQFLSPYSNRRQDSFGGSCENRIRFIRMIIEAIRSETQADFPVIMRLNMCEYMDCGLSLEEGMEQIDLLHNYGVDGFLLTGGGQERLWYDCCTYLQNYTATLNEMLQVKKMLPHVTTIINPSLHDPHIAEQVLAEGGADFISLCRPLMADPLYIQKARAGQAKDIHTCLRCNNCQTWVNRPHLSERGLCCTINPALMVEKSFAVQATKTAKKIVVIGGGLAGMSCAITAAKRGHEVYLYEKTTQLGGQWLAASAGKEKGSFRTLVPRLQKELQEVGVKLALNQACTLEEIAKLQAQEIVFATGANPRTLTDVDICQGGVPQYFAIDVLKGNIEPATLATWKNVVVLGARYIGLETSLLLAKKGIEVTVVEMADTIAQGLISRIKSLLFEDIANTPNLRVFANSKLFRLAPRIVEICHSQALLPIKADALVLAIGTIPETSLQQELDLRAIAYHSIGDCRKIGDAREAIAEGTSLGLEL